jgi:hypothetical protein
MIGIVDINFITVQMVILFIQVSFMNKLNFYIIIFIHLQDDCYDN